MKTSNKLLIGVLVLVLVVVTTFIVAARHYQQKGVIKGDGRDISEAREVSDYNGIKVRGRIQVTLTQGTEEKVEVQAASNIIPLITTTVNDGLLTIESTNKISQDESVEVRITTAQIQKLDIAEGASVVMQNSFTGDNITIDSNAGTTGRLQLQYKNLQCNLSAGAYIDLDGKVDSASFSASAGSNIDAKDLKAIKCQVLASAGSTTDVNVTDELTADINSGSIFNYEGNPKVSNIQSAAGGIIRKR